MPPRKKRRTTGKAATDSAATQDSNLVDSLPLTANALIYQYCDAGTRASLLRVSKWGRDLVLREARTITSQLGNNDTPGGRKPVVRLLDRACSADGEDGRLTVCVHAQNVSSNSARSKLLRDLFAPASGAQRHGWTSVGKLDLFGPLGTKTPVKLIAPAFTALGSLSLHTTPLTWEDMGQLSICTQLSCLSLIRCQLPQSAGTAAAENPLAALASLRQLDVKGTNIKIARGLTQLTSLCLSSSATPVADLLPDISGMSQLQQLELEAGDIIGSKPHQIQSILAISPQLTSLKLREPIKQEAFDALLAHGTRLTSLTCNVLHLTEDRSQSACNWKELTLHQWQDLQLLTYLPLHSLTHLHFDSGFDLPMPRPRLCCSSYRTSSLDTAALIRSALINLGRCPAWQQCGPAVQVNLYGLGLEADSLPLQHSVAMLSALSPVSHKDVELSIVTQYFTMGSEAVQALERVLGSRLTCLDLQQGRLAKEFWQAVWAHLPGLQQLILHDQLREQISSRDVASFCSHATHPLQLTFGSELYNQLEAGSGSFEEQCRISGVPQVTVTEWKKNS